MSATRLVYQPPKRFLAGEACYASIWAVTPGSILSLAIGAPWAYATGTITAAIGLWAVRRAFRIRLIVTADDVRVTNFWKTYLIPWEDVVAVAMMAIGKFAPIPLSYPAIGFFRRTGRLVKAQATPSRESEQEEFQAAVMGLAPESVHTLTPPPDWRANQDKGRERPSA